MHAVLMTFHTALGLDDLEASFREGAAAIRDVPGLLAKTWVQRGETLGGFYIFTDEAAAQAYLDGPIVTETMSKLAFTGFAIQHFSVLEAFSAITNGIPGAFADRAA